MGQSRLLRARQPIEAVLADPATSTEIRERLLLVLRVREFAIQLGLDVRGQYTSFVEWPGDRVVTAVAATRPGEVTPAEFRFLLLGRLPYKGFFAREKAERESVRMSERGYDTYTRPVGAYSTLGWFKDPIFSTMLQYGDTALVEVILHEMVHRTIFVKDQGAFNEGVATFVGEKGMERFFRSRGGLDPGQIEAMEQKREAKRLFQKTMFDLADRLRLLYSAEGEEEDKLVARSRIFEDGKASFRKGLEALGSTRYGGILRQDWNNALLVSYLTYHQDPDLWEALYDRFDRDLMAMVDWLKQLKGEKDPMSRIEQWVAQGNETTNH